MPDLSLDPLFRVLRERHPDVDLVILPPATPAPVDEDPVVRSRARDLVAAVGATVDEVLARTGIQPTARVEFWSSNGRDGSRSRIARAGVLELAAGSPGPLLEQVGDALLALGWDARPYADGSRRLRGVLGDLVCEAEATESSVTFEVRSLPLPISDATAAALEAGR
jgi:hypothetical protein